ncbi:amidohydrolase family protein [Desulfobulbus alkaliphilus]|uniref:amidohydrolase family protein n=1 Tax=Desulfobulbus alkaliphilus TaxID=869814 RepID=UPI001963E3F8|nr:amidohydrolase family protein [Desulfobulbus alkaliphilus]MBM9538352.1 amidohydrolase family protein [Desulfobulbus alkaliphilus]
MIDAHVYCLPPRLRQADVRLPASERSIQEAIHRHPEGPCALALSAPEAILASMDHSGIQRSVLVAFPWADPELCRENNDYLLETATENERFLAICSAQPTSPNALQEVIRVVHAGAVGIKVNPVWQKFALDDPRMDEMALAIQSAQAFLMLHVDQPYKSSPASPTMLYSLARKHPGLRILAAHLGGLLGLSALHPPVVRTLANVWYDTAVSSTLEMVCWYCQAGLADKVVLGTDFPFNHSHSQKQVVDGIRGLGLAPAQHMAIFAANFSRLARLDADRKVKAQP